MSQEENWEKKNTTDTTLPSNSQPSSTSNSLFTPIISHTEYITNFSHVSLPSSANIIYVLPSVTKLQLKPAIKLPTNSTSNQENQTSTLKSNSNSKTHKRVHFSCANNDDKPLILRADQNFSEHSYCFTNTYRVIRRNQQRQQPKTTVSHQISTTTQLSEPSTVSVVQQQKNLSQGDCLSNSLASDLKNESQESAFQMAQSAKKAKRENADTQPPPVTISEGGSMSASNNPVTPVSSISNGNTNETTPSFSASGRSQRVRKLPKRWEDDQLQVDFTGSFHRELLNQKKQATKASAEKTLVENDQKISTNQNVDGDKKVENDGNKNVDVPKNDKAIENKESNKEEREKYFTELRTQYESVMKKFDQFLDSPDSMDLDEIQKILNVPELWCICRKKNSHGSMISCDICLEWFHFSCVGINQKNVPKNYKCKQCCNDLSHNVSIELMTATGKALDDKRGKREQVENLYKEKVKERNAELKKTSAKKEKLVEKDSKTKSWTIKPASKQQQPKSESNNEHVKDTQTTTPIITKQEENEEKEVIKSEEKPNDGEKNTLSDSKSPVTKTSKSSSSKESTQQSPRKIAVSNEAAKLRKQIQATKKQKLLRSSSSTSEIVKTDQSSVSSLSSSQDANISQCPVTSVSETSSESVTSIDKAKVTLPKKIKNEEPKSTLIRSTSTSSTSSPRKSSISSRSSVERTTERRASSSSIIGGQGITISCPANCGKSKVVTQSNTNQMIYCNETCLKGHAADMLKQLRQLKRLKDKDNPILAQRPLRVGLVNRITGKTLEGKEALLEKELLPFLLKNPSYEIIKQEKQKVTTTNSSIKATHGKPSTSSTSSVNKSSSSSSTIGKVERSLSNSSSSSNNSKNKSVDLSKRQFLRTHLKEIFESRYNELTAQEQKLAVPRDSLGKLAKKIEEEMFAFNQYTTNAKYAPKSRSLIFNLKDSKNNILFRKVLLDKVEPSVLVKMSVDEWANKELAQWREKEKKATIEMITREAVDQAHQAIKNTQQRESDLILDSELASFAPSASVTTSGGSVKKTNANSSFDGSLENAEMEVVTSTTPSAASIVNTDLDKDTTAQHGGHVYSSECKECQKRTLNSNSPTSSNDKSSNILQSATLDSVPKDIPVNDTPVSPKKPKRVFAQEESHKKMLKEIEMKYFKQGNNVSSSILPLSDQSPLSSLITTNDTNRSGSTLEMNVKMHASSSSSAETNSNSQSNKLPLANIIEDDDKPIWKGSVMMTDVADFQVEAFRVSGIFGKDFGQDIESKLNVCGRITPEQVADYINKLKITKKPEISIIKLECSKNQERGYFAFFEYLQKRGRYGVVGTSSKSFKDIYILPLPKDKDMPEVLLPLNGPGLAPKSMRDNLLIGVLIRHKRSLSPPAPSSRSKSHTSSSLTHSSSTPLDNSSQSERSYTPPLVTNNLDTDSYTPPRPNEPTTSSVVSSSKNNIFSSSSNVPAYTPSRVLSKRSSISTEDDISGSKIPRYDPTERITLPTGNNRPIVAQSLVASGNTGVSSCQPGDNGQKPAIDPTKLKNIVVPDWLKLEWLQNVLTLSKEPSSSSNTKEQQLPSSTNGSKPTDIQNNGLSTGDPRLKQTSVPLSSPQPAMVPSGQPGVIPTPQIPNVISPLSGGAPPVKDMANEVLRQMAAATIMGLDAQTTGVHQASPSPSQPPYTGQLTVGISGQHPPYSGPLPAVPPPYPSQLPRMSAPQPQFSPHLTPPTHTPPQVPLSSFPQFKKFTIQPKKSHK